MPNFVLHELAHAYHHRVLRFDETTEAFISTNDFYPFTREELKRHDPGQKGEVELHLVSVPVSFSRGSRGSRLKSCVFRFESDAASHGNRLTCWVAASCSPIGGGVAESRIAGECGGLCTALAWAPADHRVRKAAVNRTHSKRFAPSKPVALRRTCSANPASPTKADA